MQVGPYRVLGEIARGGMGVVYRASDPAGRPVALKQILGQSGETTRRRFQREVEALARLRHPGVVSILACGEHEGRPWLALELVEGESLEERLRRGPLPVWEAIRVTKQLAQALSYVHACGVLHRDLKPANVLLRDGEALLTDFGLVLDDQQASRSRITVTGIFQGTPGYWAPEQALGETQRFGPHTDLYGLGAVLYACLTGRPPVQAETLQGYMAAAQARAIPPHKLRPETPEWLSALCMRCLARKPEERPGSADDVARTLLLGDAGVGARTPLLGALTAAGVLLAFALAGLGGYLLLPDDGPETIATTPDADSEAPGPPDDAPEWSSPPTPTPPSEDDQRSRAAEFREAGASKLRAGDYRGALAEFERAVMLSEEDLRAHMGKAEALATLGLHEEAIAAFTRALELEPELGAAYVNRGASYSDLGRWEEAAADFTRYLEDAPAVAGGWVNRARCYMALGRLPEAVADFSRAIELDPSNPRALGARGTARGALGRHDDAVADLSRAVALDPSNPAHYRGRAKSLIDLARHEEALADLDRVLELDPSGSLDWGQRGELLRVLGRHAEAIASLDRALQIDRRNPMWWSRRGLCRQALGQQREALTDFDVSLELYPGDPQVWFYKGQAHIAGEEYDAAEAAFREAVAKKPDHVAAWTNLGAALASQERRAEAVEAYSRAIALAPEDAFSYAPRAVIRYQLGRHREALADCERALELGVPPEVARNVRTLRKVLQNELDR